MINADMMMIIYNWVDWWCFIFSDFYFI